MNCRTGGCFCHHQFYHSAESQNKPQTERVCVGLCTWNNSKVLKKIHRLWQFSLPPSCCTLPTNITARMSLDENIIKLKQYFSPPHSSSGFLSSSFLSQSKPGQSDSRFLTTLTIFWSTEPWIHSSDKSKIHDIFCTHNWISRHLFTGISSIISVAYRNSRQR